MQLKKQMFLSVLLSLSVFISSSVILSVSAYAAVTPQVGMVRQLAEAAPNNTTVPELEKRLQEKSGSLGMGESKGESSFFEEIFEKIAVMFLLYLFLEAIQAILNDFFHNSDGDRKMRVEPKDELGVPGQEGTNQDKDMRRMRRLPAQDV